MFLMRASASSAAAGGAPASSKAPTSGSSTARQKMRGMCGIRCDGRVPILAHYRDVSMTVVWSSGDALRPDRNAPHLAGRPGQGHQRRTTSMTVPSSLVASRAGNGLPDPALYPELFDSVLWRRAFAY